MPAIRFKLCFARASCADAAAKARELRSFAAKTGNGILQLCELNLQLSLTAGCMPRKNIKNQHAAVDHTRPVQLLFKIADLRGGKFSVENTQIRTKLPAQLFQLCNLAAAEIAFYIGRILVLRHFCKHHGIGSLRKTRKLFERNLRRMLISLCKQRAKNGALGRVFLRCDRLPLFFDVIFGFLFRHFRHTALRFQKNNKGEHLQAHLTDPHPSYPIAKNRNLLPGLAQTLLEFINTPACIDKLLLAGKERMAFGANFNTDIALRRLRFHNLAASAGDGALLVLRMNSLFHVSHPFTN